MENFGYFFNFIFENKIFKQEIIKFLARICYNFFFKLHKLISLPSVFLKIN